MKFHVKDLHVFYGEEHSLKGVSLEIRPYSITALIGPSGCGKSTFLRCLNRMNDFIEGCQIRGTLRYDDSFDVLDPSLDVSELRAKVGMVFQKPNPFPMSIYNNVAYGPRCQGIRSKNELNQIVQSALEQAALWDEVKHQLHRSGLALSGGQQQRLCIARALAMKPEVLLLDEPTSALDPIATAKIDELLLQLKQHYTIVIVTHSMQQASRISDDTAFFLLGEMIEFNSTKELFSTPMDERTENYITGRFG